MFKATATLKSVSPLSQSKHYDVPEKEGESKADYEARTWRNRMHSDSKGMVFIPPMAFKNAISSAAAYLGMKIKGQGAKTFTKKFLSGVMVLDPLPLHVKSADVEGEWLFVPSDGKIGGGKRVNKCFPVVQNWEGEVTFHILDNVITEKVFQKHLETAGKFIGLGRFRPERNGFYGRFEVMDLKWEEA